MTLRSVNLHSFLSLANQHLNLSIASANSIEMLEGQIKRLPLISLSQSHLTKPAESATFEDAMNDAASQELQQYIEHLEATMHSKMREQDKQLTYLEQALHYCYQELLSRNANYNNYALQPQFSKSNLFSSIENAKVMRLKKQRKVLLDWVNQKTNKRFYTLEDAVYWKLRQMSY